MHIRDGILSPEVCFAASVISLGAVGFSLRKLRVDLEDRAVPLTGMLAAIVFAGQMVNFPLVGLPVSGHLLGGVLAAVILGPWAGCIAITLVLVVQAVLFNDGGLLSLGANVLNMGVVGAWGGYAVYAMIRKWLGRGIELGHSGRGHRRLVFGIGGCCRFLPGICPVIGYRPIGLRGLLTLMVLYHALIGVGEALITGTILAFVLARRPELISAPSRGGTASKVGQFVAAGLVAALAVAALLARSSPIIRTDWITSLK